ncbi:uncharacterized protein LOC106881852 [Octopus bimaculoides]|uniref:uncharacterized protein LOC106881852 n=1 Tax=Octopus bimaculoides TaxID=37653 RepID=UPI00071C8779|nr:uncharacterized protein LOC106881852 [Octopus bimaculoides]XP_052822801.1 uncharacterized protein LOC106881852 [Octopus bimaculoides]XP_052822802.1 uncharacterized protein LOC106881852 [Octopus bimaculoides]|eukprot:XP_014787853.1 PREDICTED: uncharacterized protein LOC106881852 [Octopus bimaculoides]
MAISLWITIYCMFGILKTADCLNKCDEDVSTCKGSKPYQKVYFDSTDSCYYDFNVNSSYYEAKTSCEEMGAHLLTIESEEEQTFVVTKLSIRKSGRWLALEKTGDGWVWYYNTIQKTLNFSKLLRESGVEENVRAFTQYNQWQPESAEAMHPFVCEFDIKAEPKAQTVQYTNSKSNITFVTFIKSGSFIQNTLLCGNFCFQTACCTVYRFDSVKYKCELYQKDFTSKTELICTEKYITCYTKITN